MKIWNYIGQFFLFRWLFGKLSKTNKTPEQYRTNTPIDPADIDQDPYTPVPPETLHRHNDPDFHDEDDELDDLDTFMNNNQFDDDDWDDHYDLSYDDFHDEQDDYDMMDDF